MLTVRVPAEVSNGGGESRWRLDALNDTVARFHANDIPAELNHVVFGAHSAIPQVLGGALTGSSAPPSIPITVMTPENKAVLITTAEPTVAPPYLRRRLDLEGHRRPRVLVIDTGLRTASQGRQNVPEHAFLRSADRREPAVHLHRGWRKNPDVDAIDDEDEHDDDGSGTLDFEAGHGTFITGIVRQVCPGRDRLPGRGAVELRRGIAGPCALDDPADEPVVRTVRRRRDELRHVLCQ